MVSVDKDIAALTHMAVQHFKEGHLQQAQDECLRILQKQQHPGAILILGWIAHQQRQLDVAVEDPPRHASSLGKSCRNLVEIRRPGSIVRLRTLTHR